MLHTNLIAARLPALFFLVLTLSFCQGQQKRQQASKASNPNFLFLSDVHLNTAGKTTYYGGDTGMDLWENFLNKAGSILGGPAAPQFIVYTGDLPAHYSCEGSCYLPPAQRGKHNKDLQVILTGLRSLATKYNKPLFYLPGNNDGLAGDYYSFADEQQQTPFVLAPDSTNPYPALNVLPGQAVAPCIVSNPHPGMGYYAARPVEGLRLVCMNTVIYKTDFTTVDGTNKLTDGNEQMTWLAGQLDEAEKMSEKVYIAMHVPPGLDAYSGSSMWAKPGNQSPTWQNFFLSLTNRYQTTIAGILYGHTHMDEVRRLYDSAGTTITAVAISCPGVTPQHKNNPGFKTVTYDAANKELLDFTTYYTTPAATAWGARQYSFSNAYPGKKQATIRQRLTAMPLTTLTSNMNKIFKVQNGVPGYNTQQGIEVKWGQ